jgi:hypothetical protein
MHDGSDRTGRLDVLLALLVVSATVLYLLRLPHTLGDADEAFFLYQAKRIRDGEIMYRDFFQFAAPGAWYVMALVFRLFGTTNTSAQVATAVLHGLTGIVLYATCRVLGVRRALALLAPVAYVALCRSAWPVASPHWFATFVLVTLLLAAVAMGHPASPRAAFGLGALSGLLLLVHQHKGLVVAGGVVTVLLADGVIARRHRLAAPSRARVLAALAAGAIVVVGPVLAVLLSTVGGHRLVQDLIVYPTHDYRTGVRRVAWGSMTFLSRSFAEYTWVTALRWAPVAFLPAAVRAATHVARGTGPRELSALVAMMALFAFSAASIAYYADFIHVAFIAPVAIVAACESVEWALRRIRPRRVGRAAGAGIAVVLAALLARPLVHTAALRHRQYPISHQTAFGRVDFAARWQPVVVDALRSALDAAGSRELFCYPMLAGPYLTAGGRNPTPFDVLAAGLSPAQLDEALAIVRARRVPYVVAGLLMARDDPVRRMLAEDYVPSPDPAPSALGAIPGYTIYVRKDFRPSPDGGAS